MSLSAYKAIVVVALLSFMLATPASSQAIRHGRLRTGCVPVMECQPAPYGVADVGGEWQWMPSCDGHQRRAAALYNRYCIRCHGVDGRGVWDVPDVPNFADPIWQASRTDEQLARLTWEGRGAVMPAFRGTLTWEESWALAYYIRELVPGAKPERPPRSSEKPVPNPANSSSQNSVSKSPATNISSPTAIQHSVQPLQPPLVIQSPAGNLPKPQPVTPAQPHSKYPSYPGTAIFNRPSVLPNSPR